MPTRQLYLVRWEDGTMRTIEAHSLRGAAALFVGTYAAPVGARFCVKERGGGGEWTWFSRTQAGVRTLRIDHV